jgi:cyclopropane fatty-acyl-phospholipid synthase-like methyltransferase
MNFLSMKNKIISKERYKNFYGKELFDKYGFDVKSIDSSKRETQETRFKTLLKIGVQKNDSVLDVACGMGDMADYFLRKKFPVKYTGFDVSKNFISYAKGKFEKRKLKDMKIDFQVRDIYEDLTNEEFDWVIICAFNLLNIDLIKKYFKKCKKGIAINSLSSHALKKNPLFPYRDPLKMFSLVKEKVSPHVVLRHDYLPHDFTIYIYKDANSVKGA